jgi:hypothetical protein
MKYQVILAFIVAFLLAVGLPVIGSARAAVTLMYFVAEADEPTDSIYLEWETATELNNTGFFITRSDSENGNYTRITAFIPAEGDGITGSLYFYFDLAVQPNVRYWYKLESVDVNNNSEFYGPVSAVLGGAIQTSTLGIPTATRTITVTPTKTATLPPGVTPSQTPSRTPTPLSSPSPTKTNPPVQSTGTPRPSGTPLAGETTPTNLPGTTATNIPTPTATLDVAPIELMFPAPTQQAVIQQVVTVVVVTEVSPGSIIIEQAPLLFRGQLGIMLGVVVLLWLVLAVFIVVYVRKVNS